VAAACGSVTGSGGKRHRGAGPKAPTSGPVHRGRRTLEHRVRGCLVGDLHPGSAADAARPRAGPRGGRAIGADGRVRPARGDPAGAARLPVHAALPRCLDGTAGGRIRDAGAPRAAVRRSRRGHRARPPNITAKRPGGVR